MRKIPAHIREQQINELPNINFIRWSDEYHNKDSKALVRCALDDYEWYSSVASLINSGTGCPKCAGMRRWTADERVEQINALDAVCFVRWCGRYSKVTSKAVVRCGHDGYEWITTVNDLVNSGKGCPQCAGNRRWTASERINQINALHKVTFVRWLDGEYRDSHSKAVCRCANCGHGWSVGVNKLINKGSGCPQCAVLSRAGKRRAQPDARVEQINEIKNIRFIKWLNGEYRNCYSKAVVRCNNGHEWSASVDRLIYNGSGCPACAEYGYNPALPGTLYALRSECGSMVKIGISNNYEQRHKKLARTTPFRWHCIELLHGDGKRIAELEKWFHDNTEQAMFREPFDGFTEWRKWNPEICEWFNEHS